MNCLKEKYQKLTNGDERLLIVIAIYGLLFPAFIIGPIEEFLIIPAIKSSSIPVYFYPFRLPAILYYAFLFSPTLKTVKKYEGNFLGKLFGWLFIGYMGLFIILFVITDLFNMVNAAQIS